MDLTIVQISFFFIFPLRVDLHYVTISDGIENQHCEEGEATTVKTETQ